ncbi:MAG: [FeFe] hydrogenase H-cluster radical SAM maturase HydE [Alkaliphilus sp.]
MTKTKSKFIIICHSTSQMLSADRELKQKGIETDLVPTPAEFGDICSTSIAIEAESIIYLEELLDLKKIEYKQIRRYKSQKIDGLLQRIKDNTISCEFKEIMEKIEKGEEFKKEDIVFLLRVEGKSEKEALLDVADQVRRKILGDAVEIRAAIEFSNYCKKSCKYCGIRKECTSTKRYRMSEDEILEITHSLHFLGIDTVILQSGEDDYYTLEKLVSIVKRIKEETKMKITLSLGERSYEEYKVLKEAGANNYLLKIETTNEEIFNFIHPNERPDKRIQCSNWLRELGYVNANGNIIGLPGQTDEDIAEDILFFKKMGIHMIGIGPFVPAKDTPFEKYKTGSVEKTLSAIAVTRIVCKNVYIPATTALASIDKDGQSKALKAGANTIMLISTPKKYRKNYKIYSDKNMVDLESAFKAVKDAGRKLPSYLKVGGKKNEQYTKVK